MRKVFTIAGRDVRSGLRDFLIVYLTVAPLLIALLLRVFIGGVGDAPLTVAVYDAGTSLSADLAPYLQVEQFTSRAGLVDRVMRHDDMFGVVATDGGYELVKQGNEMPGSDQVLRSLLTRLSDQERELPIRVVVSDIGWQMSPLKLQGATMLIIFTTVFGGMLIMLNLVEEKMSNTLSAMNVSPASRAEFIIGKGLLGFLMPIVGSLGAVTILGFAAHNLAMLVVSVVSLAFISLIIGFGIGVMANDPISGIASMKGVFIPVLASVLGAMFLAESWHFVLYWSPFYWGYQSINAILLGEATWMLVAQYSAAILAITGVVFLLLRPRIARGLN